MNLQKAKSIDLILFWEASSANLALKEKIKAEIERRLRQNKKISREFIYSVCKIGKKPLTICFIPWSKSFVEYGSPLTIDILLSDEETEVIQNNYRSNPPIRSYGLTKARPLIISSLSKSQIDLLKLFGFDTNDILSVEYD